MPRTTPAERPIEDELKDQSWYIVDDSLQVGKYHADSNTVVIPGIGEFQISGPMMRLGVVANYQPPLQEPTNFAAVVADGDGDKFVRLGDATFSNHLRWYNAKHGAIDWTDLVHPITVRFFGIEEG